MGTWSSNLYGNDTTCDVRDTYLKFLQEGLRNEEAYQKTIEKFYEYMKDEEEPLFWYALADSQWKAGRLIPEVKERAINWIAEEGGLFLWEESKNGGSGWKKTLEKLKATLESPIPREKVIRQPVEFARNPWNVGDVYAYQFHTEIVKARDLFGKYILFQKVGNAEWCEGWIFSIIQVFDKVYTEIPTLNEIDGIRILPLVDSNIKNLSKNEVEEDYIRYFNSYLKALMIYFKKIHFPAKQFTFIGNSPVPNIEYHHTQYSELNWSKEGMDDWLSDFYLQWRNVEY